MAPAGWLSRIVVYAIVPQPAVVAKPAAAYAHWRSLTGGLLSQIAVPPLLTLVTDG
jgi:hypothetical protein